MCILETKVYKFAELSEEAKEKAVQKWAEHYEYSWDGELRDSLVAFFDLFGVKCKDWEIGYSGSRSDVRLDVPYDVEELKGDALRGWVKDYVGGGETLFVACPLTGMGFDEALLDPIRKFVKGTAGEKTLKEIMEDGFYSLSKEVAEDYEYQACGEGARESLAANEYEFTEKGDMI
ncbi:MAG: hypothetical protein IPL32_19280 [Chloracidobacterium sp.]|nr:hypothetical protein [Chloracidobacterium sp.]